MVNVNTDKLFFTILTQFTYVALYHGVLPLSSTFLFLLNFFLIFITEKMFSYITKRSLSQQAAGIEVWNDIFEIVAMLSVMGSAFITTYTTDALDFYTKSKELSLLVIIMA